MTYSCFLGFFLGETSSILGGSGSSSGAGEEDADIVVDPPEPSLSPTPEGTSSHPVPSVRV